MEKGIGPAATGSFREPAPLEWPMFACTKTPSPLQQRATGPATHGEPRRCQDASPELRLLPHPSSPTPRHRVPPISWRGRARSGVQKARVEPQRLLGMETWAWHTASPQPPIPTSLPRGSSPNQTTASQKKNPKTLFLSLFMSCLYNQAGAALHAARISPQTSPSKGHVPKAPRHKVSFCSALTSGQELGVFLLFPKCKVSSGAQEIKSPADF